MHGIRKSLKFFSAAETEQCVEKTTKNLLYAAKDEVSMERKNEDPRILRSREALMGALAEELEKKSFSSISVSSLCRTAGVDRATFYRHFEDKQDLLERGIAQLLDRIIQRTGAGSPDDPHFLNRIEHLFQDLEKHRNMLRPFVSSSASIFIEERFKKLLFDFLLHQRIQELFPNSQKSSFLPEILTVMTGSALYGLIKMWLSEKPEWDSTVLAEVYRSYITGGVGIFINSEIRFQEPV